MIKRDVIKADDVVMIYKSQTFPTTCLVICTISFI